MWTSTSRPLLLHNRELFAHSLQFFSTPPRPFGLFRLQLQHQQRGYHRQCDTTLGNKACLGLAGHRNEGRSSNSTNVLQLQRQHQQHHRTTPRHFSTTRSTGNITPPQSPPSTPSNNTSSSATYQQSNAAARRFLRLLRRQTNHPLVLRGRQYLQTHPPPRLSSPHPVAVLALFIGVSIVSWYSIPPAKHLAQAIWRCSRLMYAVILDVVDYKYSFRKQDWENIGEMRAHYSRCHARAAERMLAALEDLGGIYIKLGQHLASVQVLPIEWQRTMAKLQDRCPPSDMDDLNELFLADCGESKEFFFSDFDPTPLGIASIAQVHKAIDRTTGKAVAVKLQHPHLEEFFDIDMKTVNLAVIWVAKLFPKFSFAWLAREMNENLPLEMDFRIEAKNAQRINDDFLALDEPTTLYIPKVLWAKKRVMVMEYIDGARVDDLAYLNDHFIDRNQVSKELARIFGQMVFRAGFFHADPHAGNLLIRPRQPHSKSPFNFEIVLLDHGQYFDLDDELRVNYAKFWLALIAPTTPEVTSDRRKYGKLVGNIDDSLYSILESAITGRMGLSAGNDLPEPTVMGDQVGEKKKLKRAGSMMELKEQSPEEMDHMRNTVIEREGLLADIFRMLRVVPRRVLIILKMNDLTRSLDAALATTHGQSRVFMISAKYCASAVWAADYEEYRRRRSIEGFGFRLLGSLLVSWFHFEYLYAGLTVAELFMDMRARTRKVEAGWKAWWRGSSMRLAAAGLEG